MISEYWRGILAALLLLAGVFLLSRAFIPPERPRTDSVADTLAKVAAEDEQRLSQGTDPDAEIIKSLKRHVDQGHERGHEFVAGYLSHSNPAVRAAALEAAGALSGNPFAREIEQALDGPASEARLAALKAVVRAPQGDTLEKLRAFRRRKDLNHREWYAALTALFRFSDNEKERGDLVRQLITWPVKDPSVRSEAFNEFFRLRPGDPLLLQLAQTEVARPQDSESAFYAFNYLATGDVLWLKENLQSLPVPEHRAHLSAIVDFVGRHCPPGAQKILDAVRSTKKGQQLRIEVRCP